MGWEKTGLEGRAPPPRGGGGHAREEERRGPVRGGATAGGGTLGRGFGDERSACSYPVPMM